MVSSVINFGKKQTHNNTYTLKKPTHTHTHTGSSISSVGQETEKNVGRWVESPTVLTALQDRQVLEISRRERSKPPIILPAVLTALCRVLQLEAVEFPNLTVMQLVRMLSVVSR